MHIGLLGPIASSDITDLVTCDLASLPHGYSGGPLLATIIKELLARGHTVSAFTLSNDLPLNHQSSFTATGPGLSITYVPMRPRAWRPNGWLPGRIVDLYRFEIEGLRQAVLKQTPDVLHAHWVYEFALAATASGKPYVVTCHDSPYTIAKLTSTSRPTRSLYRWLRVIMAHRTFKHVRWITAVSPYMRDAVQHLTNASITVVPNPVDTLALAMAKPRHVSALPQIAMVCNGWDSRKNPQPGLIAFKKLHQIIPLSQLHLYGAEFGPGQTAQKWCLQHGLVEGVHFHGAVSHHQLLAKLDQHNVLLHPSVEESFGMVLAEAMAMGLPIVAGHASGAVPWVAGDVGTLCDVTNPESITKALLATLVPANYTDQSQRGIVSMQQRFTTQSVVDLFEVLYQQAMHQAMPTHANTTVTETTP